MALSSRTITASINYRSAPFSATLMHRGRRAALKTPSDACAEDCRGKLIWPRCPINACSPWCVPIITLPESVLTTKPRQRFSAVTCCTSNVNPPSGYPSNGDVMLALQRKEADVWAALATTIKLAVDQGVVRAIVRGRVATPGFENLPVDEDLATRSLGKAIMGIKAAPLAIGRAFAVPPATPADRVAILREAFAKVIKDPEFLAEGKKAKIDFQYISGEQTLKDFTALLNQTPEVLKEMGKYIKLEG